MESRGQAMLTEVPSMVLDTMEKELKKGITHKLK